MNMALTLNLLLLLSLIINLCSYFPLLGDYTLLISVSWSDWLSVNGEMGWARYGCAVTQYQWIFYAMTLEPEFNLSLRGVCVSPHFSFTTGGSFIKGLVCLFRPWNRKLTCWALVVFWLQCPPQGLIKLKMTGETVFVSSRESLPPRPDE